MKGFVYILTNPAFPNYLKIGKTTRSTNERVKELSSSTGVPHEFNIVYEIRCSDCDEAEKLVHQQLEKYRISKSREFFDVNLDNAIFLINTIVFDQLTREIHALKKSVNIKVQKYREGLEKEINNKLLLLYELNKNPHSNLNELHGPEVSQSLSEHDEMLIKAIKWGKVRILNKMLDRNIQMPIHDKNGNLVKDVAESFGNLDLYNKYLNAYKDKNIK